MNAVRPASTLRGEEAGRTAYLFLFCMYIVSSGGASGLLRACGVTLHLDEPARAAHACQRDEPRRVGVVLLHVAGRGGIVGHVAQVHRKVSRVLQRHSAVFQQPADVQKQALRLLFYAGGVEYPAVAVNTGRARNKAVRLLRQVQQRAAFKGHAVFGRGVQVVQRLQVLYAAVGAGGVEVDTYGRFRVGAVAAYAGRGNEVGVGGQALAAEHVVAAAYHAGVVVVDVAHVNPRAVAVVLQVQSPLPEPAGVALKEPFRLFFHAQPPRLVGRQACALVKVDAAVFPHHASVGRALRAETSFRCAGHEHAYLGAVKRRLLNQAHEALVQLPAQGMGGVGVRLVLQVAEVHARGHHLPAAFREAVELCRQVVELRREAARAGFEILVL